MHLDTRHFNLRNEESRHLPYKCFANVASAFSVDPLFSIEQLQVHVSVECDEHALVLHAPLELHDDRLIDEVNQERLRVDWDWLR